MSEGGGGGEERNWMYRAQYMQFTTTVRSFSSNRSTVSKSSCSGTCSGRQEGAKALQRSHGAG